MTTGIEHTVDSILQGDPNDTYEIRYNTDLDQVFAIGFKKRKELYDSIKILEIVCDKYESGEFAFVDDDVIRQCRSSWFEMRAMEALIKDSVLLDWKFAVHDKALVKHRIEYLVRQLEDLKTAAANGYGRIGGNPHEQRDQENAQSGNWSRDADI